MGIWDKIRGEFIDIIEWTDASNDTMVYRFDRYGNEIKYGAKLTVRESQQAVFIHEGKLAETFKPLAVLAERSMGDRHHFPSNVEQSALQDYACK